MKKYTKDDIKVLNEGQQVKKAIEEKYESLKDFSDIEKPELTMKSIYNYCCNKKIRSKRFRSLISKALDTEYYNLVLTDVAQINKIVLEIFHSIYLYDSESDVEIFDLLLDLCKKYKLQTEIAIMLRNYAKNLYNRKLLNESMEMYNKAIDYVLKNEIDISELVLYYAEIADIYFKEKDIVKANANFEIAKSYLTNEVVNNRAKYYYYYYRGIADNNIEKYSEAIEYFKEALNYATLNNNIISQKGAVLLNIGNIYRLQRNYSESSKYYFAAILHFHDDDTYGKCSVLNSIADNYYIQEKYIEAFRYLNEAIKISNKNGLLRNSLIVAQTSTEVLIPNKEKSPCIVHYFNVLKDSVTIPIDKSIILENIIMLIDAIQIEEKLLQLKEVLHHIISKTDDKKYIDDLVSCLERIDKNIEEMKIKEEVVEEEVVVEEVMAGE